MALTARKGHAASVRRQSRQRLRSDRRYRRNRFLRFYRHLVRTGSAFPRLPRRFAPRNDTSGEREVHQRPPTVELLPTRRSLSAATGPVGGGCHFNDSLCESFVQHRARLSPPLQSTAGGLLIIHSSFFSLQYSFFYICPPCNGVCMFRLKQNPLRGSRRGSLFIAAWRGLRPYPAGGSNRR